MKGELFPFTLSIRLEVNLAGADYHRYIDFSGIVTVVESFAQECY
jgi:hypothetical protein